MNLEMCYTIFHKNLKYRQVRKHRFKMKSTFCDCNHFVLVYNLKLNRMFSIHIILCQQLIQMKLNEYNSAMIFYRKRKCSMVFSVNVLYLISCALQNIELSTCNHWELFLFVHKYYKL